MSHARFLPASVLASAFVAIEAHAQQLTLTEVASGLSHPITVAAPAGDVHRLFVGEQEGRIRIVEDGVLLPTPFLDISSAVLVSAEGGMLSFAFHPQHTTNGRFFVFFSDHAGDATVREYHVGSHPDVADPSSGRDVFGPLLTPGGGHFGSDLHFGPDGMLYYGLGDFGFQAFAQDRSRYNGKLLRLDVDAPWPHVPGDNPYLVPGDGVLDLVWARGLRQPHRFSFDRLTGDLYLGDVANGGHEEIDFQPPSIGAPGTAGYQGGRNYGWPCMEGSACTPATSYCTCDPSGSTLALPVFELPTHGAIIGGFVYRGSAMPSLRGTYFCAEWGTRRYFTFRVVNGQATQIQERTSELDLHPPFRPVSFGEDASGELYVSLMNMGKVFRIDPLTPSCAPPVAYCTTSPNSVGQGATISSTGTASIASNDLALVASGCPPDVAGFFFHGPLEASIPSGNGVRCIGGQLVRLPLGFCNAQGTASRAFDAAASSIQPGETRDFQFYYRDFAGGGAYFNLSDGLRVTFCP